MIRRNSLCFSRPPLTDGSTTDKRNNATGSTALMENLLKKVKESP
jgi:hypothetical protein